MSSSLVDQWNNEPADEFQASDPSLYTEVYTPAVIGGEDENDVSLALFDPGGSLISVLWSGR